MPSKNETEKIIKKNRDDKNHDNQDRTNSFTYHLSIILAKNKLYLIGAPLGIIFVVGVIFIILFAAVPCQFKACNANATCINSPFNAKCKCNRGFNGNGIDCDECGLNFFSNGTTTRGGQAAAHSRPATVYIVFYYTAILQVDGSTSFLTRNYSSCGGILINRKTILTSASCIVQSYDWYERSNNKTYTVNVTLNAFYPELDSIYSVYIGIVTPPAISTDLSTMQQLYVEKIIMDKDYDSTANGNDLAVIKVREKVELSQYVQLACIPDATDDLNTSAYLTVNQTAFAVGWTAPSRMGFGQYQYIYNFQLYIFNNSYCTDVLRTKGDIDGVFCAGNYTNYILRTPDSYCRGNKGSALYASYSINGKQKDLVIGILSYNYLCGLQVFTSLFHYTDWINQNSDY